MKEARNKTTKTAVVPEVVPTDAAPGVAQQPDLPAGGVPMEDAKVAGALREAWRIAKRIETQAVAAALKFGAMLAVAETLSAWAKGCQRDIEHLCVALVRLGAAKTEVNRRKRHNWRANRRARKAGGAA